MTTTPLDYDLPHTSFRDHQLASIKWLLDPSIPFLTPPISIIEAMTGSGKSAYAAAVASQHKTIVLTETKSLQDQYLYYGFVKMMGRNNFPCVNTVSRLFADATADDCPIESDGGTMRECPYTCPYLIQKWRAMRAPATCLNYHYYALVGNLRNEKGAPSWRKNFLFLDEAHQLSNICVNHFSLSVLPRQIRYYDLPDPPRITSGMPVNVQLGLSGAWLTEAMLIVDDVVRDMEKSVKRDSEFLKGDKVKKALGRLRSAKRLQGKLSDILRALRTYPDDWYINAGTEDGFTIRPLTAKHVFQDMFNADPTVKVVAMSATIGDFGSFSEELGIGDRRTRTVPSRYTPEQMPIYVYKNAPRMSAKASETDFEYQADLISEAIKECPEEWPGIIHVSRKTESYRLRDRLRKRGLESRVWATHSQDGVYIPTDEQMRAWEDRKRRVPNSIMISPSHWAGFDGLDERICIVAKAAYGLWGSPGSYEEAYRKYSMDRYRYEAATRITQGLGRTRRGRDQDYDINGETNGFVAIIDGSFDGRVKNKMNKHIVASMIEIK